MLFATDDWFAFCENMIATGNPVFIPGKFTDFGKWMDGWETRRKRIPGHDWAIIKLGAPGTVAGVEVSTAFFTGNHSPRVSIQVHAVALTRQAVHSAHSKRTSRAPQLLCSRTHDTCRRRVCGLRRCTCRVMTRLWPRVSGKRASPAPVALLPPRSSLLQLRP